MSWVLLWSSICFGAEVPLDGSAVDDREPKRSHYGQVATSAQLREVILDTPLIPPRRSPAWVRWSVVGSHMVAVTALTGSVWTLATTWADPEPVLVGFSSLYLGLTAPVLGVAALALIVPAQRCWYAQGRLALLPYLAGTAALGASIFSMVAFSSGELRTLQWAAAATALSSGLLVWEGVALSSALRGYLAEGVDLRVMLSRDSAVGVLELRF